MVVESLPAQAEGGKAVTRAELADWVMSLKPGDEVAVLGWGAENIRIGIVTKVTPTGIVRTENHGSFKLSNRYPRVDGFGNFNSIEPFTPETHERAVKNMQRLKQKRIEEMAIREAKDLAYRISYGRVEITYEEAKQLIAMFGGKRVE